ncbi:FecR family protein [Psychroserpens sp.]|uniref:FecR family protein n=1 Tax=Psychroserpens sp. TaxID=2020870 RepID=UPI001B1F5E37|nr:FecR family protein [Psychroserpens sp.]MBO6606275.1 FecR family protein [Psychroserpens sp.]MBO6631249.1 FecR family protein [Psychroserpens sp.]MBO6655129.1 FecR family protein [Psychroserpens sp.]MBO6683281.1 FecR family protein [Psychroserpens sp.]MBO6751392.1 FecR family protein [Psychroserpens sp.]
MNRESLIKKWLDHDLSPQELEEFKQLEDYQDLANLDESIKGFKADSITTDEALNSVWQTIRSQKTSTNRLVSVLSKIAAVLVIGFGIFYFTTTLDTTSSTLVAQQEQIQLPDASEVQLNAMSTLSFNSSKWDDNRSVTLSGEAFFKVAKGKKFDVITDAGTVSVLGTQFNVKYRNDYFEVTCYEGKVAVITNMKSTTLLAGDSFLILDGKYIATEKENRLNPSWLNHVSTFKSMPFKEVLAEFERQYEVEIEDTNIDKSQKFTGSFTHNDIEIALKSITLPLQLKYSKTDNIITLKRD